MCDQERLPDELVELERNLAELSPASLSISRDEVIFAAGKATALRGAHARGVSPLWRLAATCLAASLALSVYLEIDSPDDVPTMAAQHEDRDSDESSTLVNDGLPSGNRPTTPQATNRFLDARLVLPPETSRISLFARQAEMTLRADRWIHYSQPTNRAEDNVVAYAKPTTRQTLLKELIELPGSKYE